MPGMCMSRIARSYVSPTSTLAERVRGRLERPAVQPPRLGLQIEDAAVDGVVVDHEDVLAGELGGNPGGGATRRHLGRLGDDREVERGAFALDALDPHRAAHQLGQSLADGEAEAGAAVLAGGRRVELAELLEQLVRPIGRDADAGVTHGEVDLVRRRRRVRRSSRPRRPR